MKMNRRESIKSMALAMGGTLSATTLGFIMNGCSSTPTTETVVTSRAGQLFTPPQKMFLNEVAEIIIPRTDTPGAIDAEVPDFIMLMVDECYPKDFQAHFLSSISETLQKCKDEKGTPFFKLPEDEKFEFVKQLDEEAHNHKKGGDGQQHFFRTIKELTLLGYFTSKPGATQALEYVHVPGRYDACTSYEEGQKGWAM